MQTKAVIGLELHNSNKKKEEKEMKNILVYL